MGHPAYGRGKEGISQGLKSGLRRDWKSRPFKTLLAELLAGDAGGPDDKVDRGLLGYAVASC